MNLRAKLWTICLVAIAILLALAIWMGVHLAGDSGRLYAWGSYFAGCGAVFLAVGAFAAAFRAVEEYHARTVSEQARWVFELFKTFYERASYKVIRQNLDYEDVEKLLECIKLDPEPKKFSPEQRDLFDKFTDYLNFFEMVAYLKRIKQLDKNHIGAAFQYYLEGLGKTDSGIRGYIIDPKNGFENLQKELASSSKQGANGVVS